LAWRPRSFAPFEGGPVQTAPASGRLRPNFPRLNFSASKWSQPNCPRQRSRAPISRARERLSSMASLKQSMAAWICVKFCHPPESARSPKARLAAILLGRVAFGEEGARFFRLSAAAVLRRQSKRRGAPEFRPKAVARPRPLRRGFAGFFKVKFPPRPRGRLRGAAGLGVSAREVSAREVSAREVSAREVKRRAA
jgi:hypothetical protein